MLGKNMPASYVCGWSSLQKTRLGLIYHSVYPDPITVISPMEPEVTRAHTNLFLTRGWGIEELRRTQILDGNCTAHKITKAYRTMKHGLLQGLTAPIVMGMSQYLNMFL